MNQHESRIYNELIKECNLAKFERDTLAEALNQLCAEVELFETRKVSLDEAKKALATLKDRNA